MTNEECALAIDWQHNWMYSSDRHRRCCYFSIAHSMRCTMLCTPLSVMWILYSNSSAEISSTIPAALNYYLQITGQAILMMMVIVMMCLYVCVGNF